MPKLILYNASSRVVIVSPAYSAMLSGESEAAFINRIAGAQVPTGVQWISVDAASVPVLPPETWVVNWTTGQITAAPPARTWADQQADAQAALSASDTTMLRIVEAVALGANTLTAPDIAAFVSYRRNLRSIISTPTGDPSTALPKKPSYPAGT